MHCLNLKITYNCINKCEFCFSSYPKNVSISSRDIISSIYKGYNNGCRSLVITGGEPTLYQNKIIKYIEYANKLGYHKYTIQTNGYGLKNKDVLFYFLKDFSINNDISLSFSIHGYTQQQHDKMTLNKNSYNNLIMAIENSKITNCRLMSNTIISAININSLLNIYNLLDNYGFDIIQFATMHTLKDIDFYIGLLKSSAAIIALSEKIYNTNKLRTEGIPYCLLYGLEACVGESYWPDKLDIFNSKNDYINKFNQLEYGLREKADFCETCIMNEICAGVWSEHICELHNWNNPIH